MREEECSGINCAEESYGAGGWLLRTLSGPICLPNFVYTCFIQLNKVSCEKLWGYLENVYLCMSTSVL